MTEKKEYSLSIITVCYNARGGLQRTLDSVLEHKRRYPLDIEHLVVDAASTDGTPELLREWLDAGKIEAYVSEPDAGIYDAMNKGIRLARGKVLYFLNADDTLSGEPLQECVSPILQGETRQCAAAVQMVGGGRDRVEPPHYEYLYMSTPCCHQGYFASAALYRELGGYDAAQYRCLADSDFMHRAYAVEGMPRVCGVTVAVYPEVGVSCNAGFDFLPEYIRLAENNWPGVMKRCREDADYCELVAGELVNRCMELAKWQAQKGRDAASSALMLQRQLRALAHVGWRIVPKLGLRWAAGHYLPCVIAGRSVSGRMEKIIYWVRLFCSMQPGNRYETPNGFPVRSVKAALRAFLSAQFSKTIRNEK